LRLQQPSLPNSHSIAWTRDDRLYGSVTIDYIAGMSQRSYFFAEPNQLVYRPMLEWSLARAGLLAPTSTSARYGLQVDFHDIDNSVVGTNFVGRSIATYRLVHRATGDVIHENVVEANFLAIYRGLNEDDANRAYSISKPGVLGFSKGFGAFAVSEGLIVEAVNNNDDLTDFFGGPIIEASQSTWNDVTQAYVWGAGLSLVSGPALVALEQINPTNFVAFADYEGSGPSSAPAGALKGALSESGIASRNGQERARQVNSQMLAQSVTKFVIGLALQEDVQFTLILPCLESAEIEGLRKDIIMSGHRYRTDNCLSYHEAGSPRGLSFNNW